MTDATSDLGEVFELPPELDMASAPDVVRALEARRGRPVVVDCSAVTFIDSSGLRHLLDVHERWAADGQPLVLAHPTDVMRRLLQLTNLDEVFTTTG